MCILKLMMARHIGYVKDTVSILLKMNALRVQIQIRLSNIIKKILMLTIQALFSLFKM